MTTYYHLASGIVRHPGRLEAKLSDGYRIGAPDTGWTPELAALCGFVPVVEQSAPTITATQVAESTVELVNGTPTRTWTVRAKTTAEVAADTAAGNALDIEGRSRQALTANGTYLALATPTNAQTTAQVKSLTRQITALTRLMLRGDLLDNTTGT